MSNTEENPDGNIIQDIENEAELGEPESGSDDETVTIIPVPEPEVSLQSRYDKKTKNCSENFSLLFSTKKSGDRFFCSPIFRKFLVFIVAY